MSMLKMDGNRVTKNLPITHRIAEHQEEYLTLPANVNKNGIMCFAFKVSFKELIKIIFQRRIYIQTLTFGKPLQPIHVNVDAKDFEENNQWTIEEMFETNKQS